MMRRLVLSVLGGLVFCSPLQAEELQNLPQHTYRLSSAWVEIPRGIWDEGVERGTLAALTAGPLKGTVGFVEQTVEATWDMVAIEGYAEKGSAPLVEFTF
jgi:hypothetical protein